MKVSNLYSLLTQIAGSIGSDDYNTELNEVWQGVDHISIDKALVEKLEDVFVIPAQMNWQNVRCFRTLYNILEVRHKETGNVAIGALPLMRGWCKSLGLGE